MSLRLFGGFAKGFPLQVPNNNLFRPTLITLRRKFFDSFQDLSGLTFVDLCAGSGAMGLEAASYGAAKIYLNEKNPKSFRFTQSNAKAFQAKYPETQVSLSKQDSLKWLEQNKSIVCKEETILFFDPPYELKDLYESFFNFLGEIKTEFKGRVLIEADKQKSFPVEEIEKHFNVDKVFKQGSSYMAYMSTLSSC